MLFPRDGSMGLSPHTALFATCTVWGQRWNHPSVCTDSSPTTKSVGVSSFEHAAEHAARGSNDHGGESLERKSICGRLAAFLVAIGLWEGERMSNEHEKPGRDEGSTGVTDNTAKTHGVSRREALRVLGGGTLGAAAATLGAGAASAQGTPKAGQKTGTATGRL